MEGKLKYSEAIRLGGMHFKQEFGHNGDGITRACANNAAFKMSGDDNNIFIREPVACPVCGKVDQLCFIVALCLNDSHRWTFSQIADFVEKVELTQIAPKCPYVAPEMVEA